MFSNFLESARPFCIFALSVALACPAFLTAESTKSDGPEEKLRFGTLAGTTSGTSLGFIGDDKEGEINPIGGSLSKLSSGKWRVAVMNNSKANSYSANFEVTFLGENGKQIRTQQLYYTLGPRMTREAYVSSYDARDAVLNLVSAKNLSKQKTKESGNKSPASPSASAKSK